MVIILAHQRDLKICPKKRSQQASMMPGKCRVILELPTDLGEIHTERVHVQSVEEGGEVLVEARQALVHELQMHEVRFEVGHRVRQLGEGGFEGLEGKRGGTAPARRAVRSRRECLAFAQ